MPPGTPNTAPARIEQIVYRGALTHLYLRLDGGAPLLAFHQNRAGERTAPGLAVGSAVTAHWTEDSNHLVLDT